MNSIVIKGNLGADPEIKKVGKNQTSNSTFNIAVNEYKGKNPDNSPKYESFWVRIVVWGRLAELTSQLKKGDQIVVNGKLSIRTWTDNNSQKRYATEIVADEISKVQRLQSQKEDQEEAPETSGTASESLFGD